MKSNMTQHYYHSLIEVYRRFRDACCLHHQGDDAPLKHGAATQKTAIFMLLVAPNTSRFDEDVNVLVAYYSQK
jgi:hypothetical protein